jgi:hypothetical protein
VCGQLKLPEYPYFSNNEIYLTRYINMCKSASTVTVTVRWQYSHVCAELRSGQDASILARLMIPAQFWEYAMDTRMDTALNQSKNRCYLNKYFFHYRRSCQLRTIAAIRVHSANGNGLFNACAL